MKHKILLLLILSFSIFSCTDLKEDLREDLTKDQASKLVNVESLLKAVYAGLKSPYQDQARLWAAQEHTSDEAQGPTRGPDWDDNGIWRSLHAQNWTADHDFLTQTFGELLQVVYSTTNLLQFDPTPQQAAEARLIRAYVMLTVLDGWGQVPFREAGSSLLADAQVLGAQETIDFVVSECDAIIADLPSSPTNRANKDAAKVLKMKALLNKGMYLNRATPTFDNGDMTKVVALADELISSGKYSLSDKYFDAFAPDNDRNGNKENIWTYENQAGIGSGSGNSVRSRWFCGLHYNQNPSGWNGFTTLGDFYDSFEPTDVRRGGSYSGMTDVSGIKTGFLLGQQFDQNGTALKDRKGNPLAFTKTASLKESGNDLEITGIRVMKYPIDYNNGDNVDNDYVFYRFADVWMMKAEALFRSGNTGTALDMVNQLRTKRGASSLSSLTLDIILAERGREFYWEGFRRTDLLRFGKFLEPNETKPSVSGAERLLFPIPAQSLASNPNLKQNPGY